MGEKEEICEWILSGIEVGKKEEKGENKEKIGIPILRRKRIY